MCFADGSRCYKAVTAFRGTRDWQTSQKSGLLREIILALVHGRDSLPWNQAPCREACQRVGVCAAGLTNPSDVRGVIGELDIAAGPVFSQSRQHPVIMSLGAYRWFRRMHREPRIFDLEPGGERNGKWGTGSPRRAGTGCSSRWVLARPRGFYALDQNQQSRIINRQSMMVSGEALVLRRFS